MISTGGLRHDHPRQSYDARRVPYKVITAALLLDRKVDIILDERDSSHR